MWEAKIEYEYTITGEAGGMTHDGTVIKSNYAELPAISENDADEMAKDLIPNYRILSPEELRRYAIDIVDIDIHEIEFDDSTTGENAADQANAKNAAETPDDIRQTADPSINVPGAAELNEIREIDDIANAFLARATWDPRLYRRDEFFELLNEEPSDSKLGVVIRAPFASNTIATAFSDMSNIMEAGLIKNLIAAGRIAQDSVIGQIIGGVKQSNESYNSEDSNNIQEVLQGNQYALNAYSTELFITHSTKDLKSDSDLWGAQSIVNPYSLTKLVGGIGKQGDKLESYMYDIRDLRRFYDVASADTDFLSVSNPTVTQLIKWSNADKWGRTPYSFQDFVYCKYFGLIPNNRLITLRRYAAPTYDNLQFPNMLGAVEKTTKNAQDTTTTEKMNDPLPEPADNIIFSPVAYVVTWFGGETGNQLSQLMNFTTGIKWKEVNSQIWDVTGDDGETKQAVVDRLLEDGAPHLGLFGTAEHSLITKAMLGASWISSKIASYGKFHLALTGDIGLNLDAYDKLMGANVDPYDATYRNRIKGPIDRIDAVKQREAGIEFSQTLNVKCEYQAKAIGGINPKAALLDVLGNCLGMVSPHAVFWGGGHRFLVKPKLYPFHDGGWRNNFLEKIYEGKILGNTGAIATVLSGIKNAGDNGKGGFDMDTAKGIFLQLGGGMLSMLSGAINSVSSIFGGSNILDSISGFLDLKGTSLQNEDEARQAKTTINNRLGNLFTNLSKMWHNRMIAETALPLITAGGNILVGEPVGEWHLTVGNPLNPIMVVGNLICKDMKVEWNDEIGPDDFPTGFSVTYSLEHAMARDSDAIQSMFNRGMGKYYTLPDYISTSSSRITYVDKFTRNLGTGDVGTIEYKDSKGQATQIAGPLANLVYRISSGRPDGHAMRGNYNTELLTKFNGINTNATRSVASLRAGGTSGVIARVRSLANTRKQVNN